MAPKSRFSVKRQPSAGIVMAKRSFEVEDGVEENSKLLESKHEPQKLEFYNFTLEQIKLLSSIHFSAFPTKDSAGRNLRSAEPLLAQVLAPFFHDLNKNQKKDLDSRARVRGFKNFSSALDKNSDVARQLIIEKISLS
jgi:hypothetical protein